MTKRLFYRLLIVRKHCLAPYTIKNNPSNARQYHTQNAIYATYSTHVIKMWNVLFFYCVSLCKIFLPQENRKRSARFMQILDLTVRNAHMHSKLASLFVFFFVFFVLNCNYFRWPKNFLFNKRTEILIHQTAHIFFLLFSSSFFFCENSYK